MDMNGPMSSQKPTESRPKSHDHSRRRNAPPAMDVVLICSTLHMNVVQLCYERCTAAT